MVLHTIYGSAVGPEAQKHGICRVVEKAKAGALVSTVDELMERMRPERAGERAQRSRIVGPFIRLRETVLNCQLWRSAFPPLPTIPEVVG
jgi:hypothetical protein